MGSFLEGGDPETLTTLLTDFAISPRSVGYTKEASNLPAMLYDIGSGLCVCMKFDQAPVAASNVPKIAPITARRLVVGLQDNDASVAISGSWSGHFTEGGGYKAGYNYTSTAGNYAEWTTPAGVTLVHYFGLSEAGIALVTIDGGLKCNATNSSSRAQPTNETINLRI